MNSTRVGLNSATLGLSSARLGLCSTSVGPKSMIRGESFEFQRQAAETREWQSQIRLGAPFQLDQLSSLNRRWV